MLKYLNRLRSSEASELLKEALSCNETLYKEHKERFEQMWNRKINGISNQENKPNNGPGKLRTYIKYKSNFKKETYTECLKKQDHIGGHWQNSEQVPTN
jgi:hypothetical protein